MFKACRLDDQTDSRLSMDIGYHLWGWGPIVKELSLQHTAILNVRRRRKSANKAPSTHSHRVKMMLTGLESKMYHDQPLKVIRAEVCHCWPARIRALANITQHGPEDLLHTEKCLKVKSTAVSRFGREIHCTRAAAVV